MKIKRYKKVNKTLGFYNNNFGFRQPYQLLIDGTFCYTALNNQINISENIPKYLLGDVKLLTTQCAIIEMEKLGWKLQGALMILKKYPVHKCGHEGKPIAGSKCFLSMLGKKNEQHYILATQDRDLQKKVRNIPGAPLLYLHIKTPVLEHPSPVSEKEAQDKLAGLGDAERAALEKLKAAGGLVKNEDVKRKKKKKKGVNPLSCRKKKNGPVQQPIVKKEGHTEIEKRKRKRIRIPQHVKDVLKN